MRNYVCKVYVPSLLKGEFLVKNVLVTALAVIMAASPVLACDTCGDTSSNPTTTNVGTVNNGASSNANATSANGYNTTVNTPQNTTNNVSGVSNPISTNQNYQINNNLVSQVSFGGGVQCQSTSLALSGYDGSSNTVGYAKNNAYGLAASLIVPIGGKVNSNCAALSNEILLQRQIGTCTEIFRDGFDIDKDVAPELFARCSVLRRHPVVVVAPPPTPVPVTVVRTVVERVPYVVTRQVAMSCDSATTPTQIRHLVAREKFLMHHTLGVVSRRELTQIRHRLDRVCNQDLVSQALDGGNQKLP